MLEIADEDHGLAPPVRRRPPMGIDRGHACAGTLVRGEMGDIAARPVGEVCDGDELPTAGLQLLHLPGFRSDREPHAPRGVGRVGLGALRDPVAEDRIRLVARQELPATAVRHLHERLPQKEARLGLQGIHATAEILADERRLIERLIESSE